jgi:hypothetical protein
VGYDFFIEDMKNCSEKEFYRFCPGAAKWKIKLVAMGDSIREPGQGQG